MQANIIEPQDIYSRIYRENVALITQEDEELIYRAIAAAISEVKMYLSRYDLPALFGDGHSAAPVSDMFLKNLCVDIAVWRLLLLGCPGISHATARECYESALNYLRDIQAMRASPDGWPYRDTTASTAPQGNTVEAAYIPKRFNDF